MLADTTGNASLGNAASTIVIAYIFGECVYLPLCKDPVCFVQLSAGRPGRLVVTLEYY